MSRPTFPFAALVGLDTLKLALQLAAVDHRLSVLIRGDKGAGKTTAARALSGVRDDQAPFVNLPIGVTEDRLLGGLDIERALKGEPALRRGLLAEASGGVLYIDEVNLLPDHLADALLDAVASGLHIVERDGFSAEQVAAFVLIGSMNPEEGSLRPQLLDRFALAVDVAATMEPALRRDAVLRRLRFDEDPAAFGDEWREEQEEIAHRLRDARARLPETRCDPAIVDYVSGLVCQRGVASLRADLALVRASRARAALDGRDSVAVADVDEVLPLVMSHRARHDGPRPPAPPSPEPSSGPPETQRQSHDEIERIFTPLPIAAPKLVVAGGVPRSVAIGARQTTAPREVDVRASLVHAIGATGTAQLRPDDLHEKRRAPEFATRFIFVLDASGSQAAHQRMRLVKGAVAGLLDRSLRRRDEVVVIVFRGAAATVLVEPTSALEEVETALAYLPTGGRTPLAHGLELAARYITDASTVVLLTDGRANVPTRTTDAWADALTAASALACPALVIDSAGSDEAGTTRALADAMHATYARLETLNDTDVVKLLRVARD